MRRPEVAGSGMLRRKHYLSPTFVEHFIGFSSCKASMEAGATMSGLTKSLLAYVEARDHRVMRRVHSWSAPKWIRLWMVCATRGGDGWLWYALGLCLATFGGSAGREAAAQAALASGAGIVLFLILKRAAGRRRPCALEPHCWATLLPPDKFSFPSGHSITAFATAVPVSAQFPEMTGGLFFCAASIAASRVLLGMHFLSDVVAGAILGAALGSVARAII
jgi:undecaprenyl-diphosphatase